MFVFATGLPAAHEHASLSEIWTSFASLVRAYLAAAELGVPGPQARVEQFGERITIEREGVRLLLDRDAGRWELARQGERSAGGSFHLDAESRITWEGRPQPLELDASAEWIAEMFVEREREGDPDTATEAAGESGGE